MSVTVQEQPFAIGWAGNRNRLKLHSDDGQLSAGSLAHFMWSFPSPLGADGTHVVVSIDGFLLIYTIGSGTDAYSVSTRSSLTIRIRDNYYVKQLFDVVRTTSSVELTAKAVGHHVVEVYFTDSEGVRTETLVPGTDDEGSDRTGKPNFAILVCVDTVVNNGNVLTTHSCGGMVYNPDANGDVEIDLAVIRDFLPPPDLPSVGDSVFQLLANAMLKYRVSYGEMWGEESPRVQNWDTTSGWFYALCGEETERYAALNLPDWKSGQAYRAVDDGSLFWIIGEDTGKTMRVRRSQREFLYGLFYDGQSAMGAAPVSGGSVTVTLTGYKSDDTMVTVEDVYTPNNGQVYRIDASPSRFGVDVLRYTVAVRSGNGNWSRNYIVLPDFHRQSQFLLQTKYGVLKSVVSGELHKKMQTEADVVRMDGRRYLDFTERGEVYTAVLDSLSREEARRIAQCVCNEYHYFLHNGRYERITIEAGSFATRDDSNGLVTLEFSFRFVENQQENATNGDTSRTAILPPGDPQEPYDPTPINNLFT